MDPNLTAAPPADAAAPPPASPPPPREGFGDWFRANGTSSLITLGIIALVCYYLHPLDVLLAVVGLGGIVFLHELGHFMAAKACDVHVSTFSIGFGPPLPFCQYTYGETKYKLAMIPLGGFVAMVGEGDARSDVVEGDETGTFPADYPRSFANKPVWQRMIIISAGVIMNILLAAVCFVVVYLHGVDEQPAVVQAVDPGSAAWRAGIRPGEELTKLNGLENNPDENKKKLWFDDIRPIVSSTHKGETVDIATKFKGEVKTYAVEPVRAEGALFPQLGISPPQSTTLLFSRRDTNPPFEAGSPASLAKAADGTGFQSKDKIIAMSDPAADRTITDLRETTDGLPGAQFDFRRRMHQLAGQDVTVRVERQDGSKADIVLPKTFRKDLGLRMTPGQVTAIRTGSPAEKAGIKVRKVEKGEVVEAGDEVLAVTVTDGSETLTFDTSDPIRLPVKLNAWAAKALKTPAANRDVKLSIRRAGNPIPFDVPMTWDDSYRTEPGLLLTPSSPVAIDGLGLAFQVSSLVADVFIEGAAFGQVQKGDRIKSVRFKVVDFKGVAKDGPWQPVGEFHYAYLDSTLQQQAPYTADLKVDRGGTEVEITGLVAKDDASWPVAAGGLLFGKELRVLQADGVGEALGLGLQRTIRMVKTTYQGLYALVAGRVSVKVMSGPITLARAGYILAGESVWKLVLLIGLISVNLAVVNFLPIPVLDGGHMMFLLYEGVRGKKPPAVVFNVLTYIGLAMVLSLMLFTIGLDIWRLLFW